MATTSVISLIAKLLAIQEGRGATEAEASLAAERVQELLQKHNLTLSEVEANGGSSDVPGSKREVSSTGVRAMYSHSRQLMKLRSAMTPLTKRVRSPVIPWGLESQVGATTRRSLPKE